MVTLDERFRLGRASSACAPKEKDSSLPTSTAEKFQKPRILIMMDVAATCLCSTREDNSASAFVLWLSLIHAAESNLPPQKVTCIVVLWPERRRTLKKCAHI
jgi:hypothetical protein